MKALYRYESIDGTSVPSTTSDISRTLRQFEESLTPITILSFINDDDEARLAIDRLQLELANTPTEQTGLVYSLNQCIKEIREWIVAS